MGLDVNNEMNISAMKTFLSNTGKILENSNNSLQSIFNSADTDGNGGLDSNEVSLFLKQWNMEGTYSNEQVMSAVDSNGDGKIEFSEIKSYASSLGVNLDGNMTLADALGNVAGLGGGVGNALSGILNTFSNIFGNKS